MTPSENKAKEIIRAMLDSGHKQVLCLVGGDSLRGTMSRVYPKKDIIYGFHPNGYFLGCFDTWETAVPIDTETGKVIIDYTDGKVILESEQ